MSASTAKLNAVITNCGNALSLDYGFEYVRNDQFNWTKVPVGKDIYTGNYSANLSNLTDGVTYYVYAYNTNSAGTSFGDILKFTTLPLPNFTDLKGHWAQQEITVLAATGIISGYPDSTFMPDDSITRAECAAIIAKVLGLQTQDTSVLDTFSDAASIPAWARQALAAVVKAGLIKGVPGSNGKLALNAQSNITRQELAVISANMLTQKLGAQKPAELTFADQGALPAWAQNGVQIAVANYIVKGYPDNTFRGAGMVTRAECAEMISHVLRLIKS